MLFSLQVAVPLPDVKGRAEILEYYLSDKPVAAGLDQSLLARQTSGFSGADLSNLVGDVLLSCVIVLSVTLLISATSRWQQGWTRRCWQGRQAAAMVSLMVKIFNQEATRVGLFTLRQASEHRAQNGCICRLQVDLHFCECYL
jgi:hypothetical protein